MNTQKFIQNKLDMIKNEPENIQGVADILINCENSSKEELNSCINEYYGNQFHVSDMINEWEEYARIAYIKLQIAKNYNYVSVASLNATIFVFSFIEKFLKFGILLSNKS
jgi:hypothetical protein